jgi:hypothetical protein
MSSLRPTAAAFVPSFTVSTSIQPNASPGSGQDAAGQQDEQQQQQQQAQPEQHFAEDADAAEEAYEDEDEEGYYDELGNWVQYDGAGNWPQDWQHYSSGTWQEQQPGATQQAEEEEDAIWQCTEDSNEQAVQLLHSWFPSQPLPLLRQLMDACDGRLQEALQIISDIDSEQQQQQQQIRPSSKQTSSSKAASQANQQVQLSLQDDELFPALPAAAATAQQQQPPAATARPAPYQAGSLWDDKPAYARSSSNGSSSNTSSWSALAKAAAAAAPRSGVAGSSPATTSRAATGMATATTNNDRASSKKAAAGVVEAEQHAVPWVQTGEAVAQEYAAARAEASDHARVRNACFQQATQAYLAGER